MVSGHIAITSNVMLSRYRCICLPTKQRDQHPGLRYWMTHLFIMSEHFLRLRIFGFIPDANLKVWLTNFNHWLVTNWLLVKLFIIVIILISINPGVAQHRAGLTCLSAVADSSHHGKGGDTYLVIIKSINNRFWPWPVFKVQTLHCMCTWDRLKLSTCWLGLVWLVGWVRQKPFLWNPSVNQGVGGALFLEAKQFWNVFDILPLFWYSSFKLKIV